MPAHLLCTRQGNQDADRLDGNNEDDEQRTKKIREKINQRNEIKGGKAMNICVSTREDILLHKKKDGLKSKGCECFWEFDNKPAVNPGDKLFFLTCSAVRGYFIIHKAGVEGDGKFRASFYSETWTPLKEPIFQHHFQGFMYVDDNGKRWKFR
jgi:hypothetical protein